MNKNFFATISILFAIIIGVSINNIAMSSDNEIKVGVVDLSELITNSPSVKILKSTHDKQVADIEKLLEQARVEMSKETDAQKITQIEEKYRKQVADKKLQMDKNYNDKLMEIDKGIKAKVAQKAKEMKYTVVLPKTLVLYGGEDITAQIAKEIK